MTPKFKNNIANCRTGLRPFLSKFLLLKIDKEHTRFKCSV